MDYKLEIQENGRYTREAITKIVNLHSGKRNWSLDCVEDVITNIYTIAEFPTYNPRTKTKKTPEICRTEAFQYLLEYIAKYSIRYVETNIQGYIIKFYTRDPKYYKHEYYLEISKNITIINI